MSGESSWSQATSNTSVPVKMEIDQTVKPEVDQTNSVDEETSNAASILNGVSKDRRTVRSIQLIKLTSDKYTSISGTNLSLLVAGIGKLLN
jgi:hypothetical protein